MSESTLDPSAGATGGDTSHEADINAGYDDEDRAGSVLDNDLDATAGDSHAADVDAAFDGDDAVGTDTDRA